MTVPRISDVKIKGDLLLDVVFDDGAVKEFDVAPYVRDFETFKPLENSTLFKTVHVDVGGMGLVWNSAIDLSRYDVWELGVDVR